VYANKEGKLIPEETIIMEKRVSASTGLDDNENPEKESQISDSKEYNNHIDPSLSRTTLNALYLLIFAMSLFANIDHGTLPAGSVVIKKDLGMDNA